MNCINLNQSFMNCNNLNETQINNLNRIPYKEAVNIIMNDLDLLINGLKGIKERCSICLDDFDNNDLFDCDNNHKACCNDCKQFVDKCPICRKQFNLLPIDHLLMDIEEGDEEPEWNFAQAEREMREQYHQTQEEEEEEEEEEEDLSEVTQIEYSLSNLLRQFVVMGCLYYPRERNGLLLNESLITDLGDYQIQEIFFLIGRERTASGRLSVERLLIKFDYNGNNRWCHNFSYHIESRPSPSRITGLPLTENRIMETFEKVSLTQLRYRAEYGFTTPYTPYFNDLLNQNS